MEPNPVATPAVANNRDALPLSRSSPNRVHMGRHLSGLIRRTIASVMEPLSPARAEWDIELADPTPDLHKSRKGADSLTKALARPRTPHQPRNFNNLPPELHMVLLQHLDFVDIHNLRRTCKYWYNFANPRLVQAIWGREMFEYILTRHCRLCMAYRPKASARLPTTPRDAGYPLSSRCVECAVQARDGTFRVGRKTKLGNFVDYWVCRWCGWPVTEHTGAEHPQFHKRCYTRYAVGMLFFFLLGWLQLFLGIVASAMCWRYFRGDKLVLGPTIAGFLLMWLCVFLIGFQRNGARVYHWALLLEMTIVGLWIAPVYSISKHFNGGHPSQTTRTTMALIGTNMVFRLFNIMGNIVLLCDYDRAAHYLPQIPIWRVFINPLVTALILWTWPMHAARIPSHYSTGRGGIV
ncbi:hypothetical protein SLS53_008618 [Cytospora paraplurivora]|uniref:F-box domain-containing protein n=1 Tax=Cytospora paraplurivora TaxID=2898453 RepID=A0AAN9TXR9_9PEZI